MVFHEYCEVGGVNREKGGGVGLRKKAFKPKAGGGEEENPWGKKKKSGRAREINPLWGGNTPLVCVGEAPKRKGGGSSK